MNDDSTKSDAPAWGGLLISWMALAVVFNGLLWITGVRDFELAEAVEQGAARVEERSRGQDSEDVIRKEIQLQRDTLPFWTTLRLLADFLIAPLALALRPLFVSISFSGVAALTGRPVRYAHMMADGVRWQGVWVLRLAVHVVLMLVFWRSSVESSVLMLFPQGVLSAPRWAVLRQLDLFALMGWLGMAWSGCRQRQANLFMALLICAILAVLEAVLWASGSLLLNLGMRLTLMPQ